MTLFIITVNIYGIILKKSGDKESPYLIPLFGLEKMANVVIYIDGYITARMKESAQVIHLGEKLIIHNLWNEKGHFTLFVCFLKVYLEYNPIFSDVFHGWSHAT